jgi:hypothetical protein
MKRSRLLRTACCIASLLVLQPSANATLIGDVVTAEHYFTPAQTPSSGLYSTTVQTGSADILCPENCSYYTIDVEADSIHIAHFVDGFWNTDANFNGVIIHSLNDSSGNPLARVTTNTDISNWNPSMLSFDDDTIWINFINPYATSLLDGSIVLTLDYGISAIPLPAAAWLFGSGLLGLVGMARRKKAA